MEFTGIMHRVELSLARSQVRVLLLRGEKFFLSQNQNEGLSKNQGPNP